MNLDLSENNIRREILAALVQLRDQPATRIKGMGICGNVEEIVEMSVLPASMVKTLPTKERNLVVVDVNSATYEELEHMIRQWPALNESFDVSYPVGGEDEYEAEVEAETLWQNPRRLELLNWLIAHAEELLNVA